jgi:NodT family efflux transporter outer membrane factor (OMF) lipoprotein
MLAAGIASAYVDLDRLHAERDVRQGELDVRTATQNLVSQRRANGLETRGSTRQADAEVANARNALSAADEQIALRQHQIAALIGAGPDRGLAVARPALAATVSRDLPEGVTTDLVGRRPDVAAARARVEAAASRIRVARADFYPAIRLTALFGVQALGLGQLFDGDSTYGRVGPAVSLPVFHGGAIQGRYRGARASYDEAVASYDQTVVAAYQQVADAVTSQRAAGERLVQARAARAAAQDAYDIARLRYEGGLSNYLDVLTVQDRLLQSRLAVAGLEASLRSLDIALVRALGGGFTAPPARTTDISLKDPTHG